MSKSEPSDRRFYDARAVIGLMLENGRFDDADREARVWLEEAHRRNGDWNHGNAIHFGNIALGRVALARGDADLAASFLLSASQTEGSPQLCTFGPGASLARDLLGYAKADVVVQYLINCKSFWAHGLSIADGWIRDIHEGRVPDFGFNATY